MQVAVNGPMAMLAGFCTFRAIQVSINLDSSSLSSSSSAGGWKCLPLWKRTRRTGLSLLSSELTTCAVMSICTAWSRDSASVELSRLTLRNLAGRLCLASKGPYVTLTLAGWTDGPKTAKRSLKRGLESLEEECWGNLRRGCWDEPSDCWKKKLDSTAPSMWRSRATE